jgi:hypothetical protein
MDSVCLQRPYLNKPQKNISPYSDGRMGANLSRRSKFHATVESSRICYAEFGTHLSRDKLRRCRRKDFPASYITAV